MIAFKYGIICNSILILITLYLTSLVSSENVLKDNEKECSLPDQRKGVCRPSSECPDKGIGSVSCSKQGNIIYVCCEPTADGPVHSNSKPKPEPSDERKHNRNTTFENDASDEEISDRFLDHERGFQNWDYSWTPEKNFRIPHIIDGDIFQDDVRGEYGNYDFGNNQGWQWSVNGNQFIFNPDAVPGYEFPSNPKKQNNRYPDNNQSDEWSSHNYAGGIYQEHNERQHSQNYPWNSNRRTTTQRPYYPDNNRGQNTQKYPWESDRRTTTQRPYYPNSNSGQDNEEYLWGTNRRTTKRPYYPDNNKGQNTQKYPWESDRRTTERSTTRRPIQWSNYRPPPDSTRPPHSSQNGNRKRISEIMCDEYSKPVTEVITGLPLIPNPVPIEIKVEKCIFAHQLIVGGENTTIGEFPHMAAVGYFDNARNVVWKCGGSLISDQFVLTAAHCVITTSGKPVRVRLGEYNINKTDDGASPEDYWIVDIITHPDYKPSSKYNDIALLKLSRKVTINKSIRPACLNVKHTIPETKVIAIGWGRVDKAGGQSDVLLKVGLDLIDKDICRNWYNKDSSKNVLHLGIVDSQICAGDLFDKKDTCKGDSGGPIEVTSQSNRCIHYIVGITSFGRSCAVKAPGVYTRVSSYVPWIESIVWPGQ